MRNIYEQKKLLKSNARRLDVISLEYCEFYSRIGMPMVLRILYGRKGSMCEKSRLYGFMKQHNRNRIRNQMHRNNFEFRN